MGETTDMQEATEAAEQPSNEEQVFDAEALALRREVIALAARRIAEHDARSFVAGWESVSGEPFGTQEFEVMVLAVERVYAREMVTAFNRANALLAQTIAETIMEVHR